MSNDTVDLLKECDAGCKSATNSMEQVQQYLEDGRLKKMIDHYNEEHIHLGEECHKLLNEAGEEEKDPNVMAKAFSWITTEMKMMIDGDEKKAADIMVDGCNMGIKSLVKYLNQYKAADKRSKDLTSKLIHLEEHFRDELLGYL